MAEAIGLAASVLTLTDAAVRIGRMIRSLKHAPEELSALNSEIVDLKDLFHYTTLIQQQDPEALSNLSFPLQKADQEIQAVKSLVHEYSGHRLAAFDRVKWVVVKKRLKDLVVVIRERRNQINALLAVNNLYFGLLPSFLAIHFRT